MSDSDSDTKSDISVEAEVSTDMAAFKYDMRQCEFSYSGNPNEDYDTFISVFENYAELRDFTDAKKVLALKSRITGNARIFLDSVPSTQSDTIEKIKQLLKSNFQGSSWRWGIESKLLSRKQMKDEVFDNYVSDVLKFSKQLNKSDSEQLSIFVRGLLPSIRGFVFAKEPKTFKEALDAARLGISVNETSQNPVANIASVQAESFEDRIVNNVMAKVDTRINTQINSVLSPVVSAVSNLSSQFEKFTMQDRPKQVSFDPKYSEHSHQQSAGSRRKITCYRCGREGHVYRKCYARRHINGSQLN